MSLENDLLRYKYLLSYFMYQCDNIVTKVTTYVIYVSFTMYKQI